MQCLSCDRGLSYETMTTHMANLTEKHYEIYLTKYINAVAQMNQQTN